MCGDIIVRYSKGKYTRTYFIYVPFPQFPVYVLCSWLKKTVWDGTRKRKLIKALNLTTGSAFFAGGGWFPKGLPPLPTCKFGFVGNTPPWGYHHFEYVGTFWYVSMQTCSHACIDKSIHHAWKHGCVYECMDALHAFIHFMHASMYACRQTSMDVCIAACTYASIWTCTRRVFNVLEHDLGFTQE